MTLLLWALVFKSIITGFAFLVPFAFFRTADISFGVVLALKLDSMRFDKKKFWQGILYTLITLFGLACLIAGITMIPPLLEYYKITAVDVTAFKGVLDVTIIISSIVMSAITYGKDAFDKFKLLLNRGAPPDDTTTETTNNK